jgi:tetratricopeptide (TPR) repeat protein
MAKGKKTGKPAQGSEILESPDVLAEQISKTEQFIEENKRWVFGAGGALAVIVAAFFLYRYYVTNQNNEAQSEMFQAVYYFEADSLDRALNGDGNNLGLIQIIEDYPWTESANLAHYYAGICYLKKGEYISAVDQLEQFSVDDLLVQARGYALIGDAYMEMENYEEAVSWYNKARAYRPNENTTPIYLLKAATAYEMLEDWESALKCYDIIVSEYVNSGEYQDARKHKARVETKISG